jgi:peptide/nickel transport system substrate-binding protein
MVVREGFTIHDQIAAIVQGTWRELGLNVRISRLSPSEYMDVTQGHKAQSYIRINGPGVIDAGYYLGYDMVCGIGFNLTEVCIEEADEALKLARQETDPVKQQALYDKITRLWNAASPKIPVYAVRVPSVLNKRVTQYHYVHETDFRFWSKN